MLRIGTCLLGVVGLNPETATIIFMLLNSVASATENSGMFSLIWIC